MRLISGLTGIDRYVPETYANTPEEFYRESKRLIGRYHKQGRNLYAITPRYALGSSPELMQACQRLKHEHPDCWVNTHISETRDEVSAVQKENPDCADYLAVYEKYVAENFQQAMANTGEIQLDQAAKLIGCWNGLAKNFGPQAADGEAPVADKAPMRNSPLPRYRLEQGQNTTAAPLFAKRANSSSDSQMPCPPEKRGPTRLYFS